jgi:hypothetical protein
VGGPGAPGARTTRPLIEPPPTRPADEDTKTAPPTTQ